MKYGHIRSAIMSTPWAILPEKLGVIMALIAKKVSDENRDCEISADKKDFPEPRKPYLLVAGEPEPDAPKAGPTTTSRSKAGAIAVLPLFGTIGHRMGMMSDMSGGTSTEKFTGWLRAAVADPTISAIVIDIDSPGGGVAGVSELGDEIFQARSQKPVVAVANAQAASAAYWLGSQASELVVTPSGEVGSIGVFAAHEDVSKAAENQGVHVSYISAGKYKTEANPFEPLGADAREAMQAKVDSYYSQFVNAVARGRGTDAATVRSKYGEGRMLMAKDALAAGMVDRVATLDRTLQRLGARKKPAMGTSSAGSSDVVPCITGSSSGSSETFRIEHVGIVTIKADGSDKIPAATAGYMELPGAEKDGQCSVVDVAGGISLDKGCCNLFDPMTDPPADEFCCDDCTASSGDTKGQDDAEEAAAAVTTAPRTRTVSRKRLMQLYR